MSNVLFFIMQSVPDEGTHAKTLDIKVSYSSG